jgi:uncharacterized protein YktA (UPF0223 family)
VVDAGLLNKPEALKTVVPSKQTNKKLNKFLSIHPEQ